MPLRFKEANGRHFEDPASDSSWTAHEVKDLDSRHGSHIRPGKLKAAVLSGKVLDLDDYFQLGTVLSEPQRLQKEIDELNARLQGLINQVVGFEERIEKSGDKRETADLIAKIKAVKDQQNEVGKAIAEKLAAIAKLAADAKAAADLKAKNDADAAAVKAKADQEAADLELAQKTQAEAEAKEAARLAAGGAPSDGTPAAEPTTEPAPATTDTAPAAAVVSPDPFAALAAQAAANAATVAPVAAPVAPVVVQTTPPAV